MFYDMVINGGTVIDPKSGRSTVANLGIEDGKIRCITREEIQGNTIIDAVGFIVCPGFIDPHAHVEGNADCAEVMVAMGVTTVINGNCGISPEDMKTFLNQYEKEGFLINNYEQVGHTTLREIIGNKNRYAPSTKEQIDDMKKLVDEAFSMGACGLSFGLEYVPGSSKEEVLELSKVAAKYGKPISIHTRSDCYSGLSSLQEAILISRRTGAEVHISHLTYMFGLGMAAEALRIIELAQAEGLDISVDSGLYSGFATKIGSAVFDEGFTDKWSGDYSCIVAGTGKYRGQRLTEKMYRDLRENYPQDAGTYPRFFKTMIREQNRINIIDAINRCTYMVANRFGINGKGYSSWC